MAIDVGFGLLLIGCLWLLSAQPVHSRGDTFLAAPMPGNELEEQENRPDEILEINRGLILPEAPESSFLLEGDILKVSPFRPFSSANLRWPKKKGVVQIPYVLSYKYDQFSLRMIGEAFEDFAKFTCVRFVPYVHQRDFISIVPLAGCFSSVGRIGGVQVVSLAPACLRRGKGAALHELMHVLGFWHEHSRADRDKYISIAWNEILTGFEINFIKSWNINMLGAYDYSSVMHYGRNAFSLTGSPTIIPLADPSTFLGQRGNLSNSDIARINKLYKCSHSASQPEVATGDLVKEKVMGFIPSAPESWAAENNPTRGPNSTAFNRGTTEPIVTPPKILGLNSTANPHNHSHFVPDESLGTTEASRGFLMATEQVLDTTQEGWMETKMQAGALANASALQTPVAGRPLPTHLPSSSKAPRPSEERASTASKVEHLFSSRKKGPALPLEETDHRTTKHLGKDGASVELSGTKAAYLEPTAVELASVSFMGSGKRASSSTEGYQEAVAEKQPNEWKGVFHQPVSRPINETGGPLYAHPGEDAWNKVTHSSYRSSPRSNPTTVSGVVETQSTEGPTYVATRLIQSRPVGKEPESLYLEKGTGSTYSWLSTSRRPHAANHRGEALPPSKETSVPGIPEAQTNSFDWATPGEPSSLRRRVTGYPSALGPSYSSSAGYSRTEEPTHPVGEGYRWSTSVSHKPLGSASLQELLKEAGQQVLNFTELPSQTPTWGALMSLAIETKQRGQPTDQTFLPLSQSPSSARLGSNVDVSGVTTVGGSPPADRQRRTFEQSTETASIATTERPSMTQKIDVVHERGHGRTTLVGQFSTVSSGSQASPQLERGTEQTQRPTQPDSTFLIITGTGRSEIQTGRSNGRRIMGTPKQCGGSSEPGTIAFPTEHTHKRMTSLYRPLSLGMARNGSPRPITQEYGSSSRRISRPGKERSTSPWWERGSKTPKGSHGTRKETSTAMNKVMQTKTRAPESNGVSRTSTSEPTVGPSSIFTILAQRKSTWKRIQSSFSLGRTESARNAESLSTQLLEQVTGAKVSSRRTIPSAEGRSAEPANPTVDFTTDGMSRVSVPVQEGTIPTSTEGTALFPPAGSFLAPKLVNRVGGTHYIPRTDTSSLPSEIFPHGTTVAPTLSPSSAITQGSRENQTIVLTDAEEVTRSPSKESGMGQMVSTLVSAGIHWIPHVGISTPGSPEGHTEVSQAHSELQTGVEHREETLVPFQENLTKQRDLRASEEPLFATHAGIVSTWAKPSRTGMPVATSLRMKSSSPLTSTYSTEEAREPTLFWRKENTLVSSARPSNKGYSVALLPFRSAGTTETLKMTPTVSDTHKLQGSKKMEIAGVHQVGREAPKEVSARTLPVHLQTPGSAEMEKESYRTSRTGPLDEATKVPTRMGKREQFPLATESPRPALETPVTVKLVDLAGSHRMGKKVGNKRAFPASSLPTFLHPINKRSLPRTSAKRPSLIMPSPDPDCNLLTSNIGDLNPRKWNIMSSTPKERDVKFIMASLGGSTQQLPPPGCPPQHFSHFKIGQVESVALPVKNTTAVVARNPQVRSTSRPKPLPHFQWLPPLAKKVRNNRRPRISNRPAMACSFKGNFCGWTQSQNDSLDWFLVEEEAPPTSPGAESSISAKAFRTLDGYISLKPSSHHPNQKAVLISPTIRGITCLKFWYRPMDSATGRINFYVKPLNTAEWQKVWSAKGSPDTSWHQVIINTSRIWPLQVALEGITGAKVGHEAEVDDLVLCRSPCVQC